MREKLVATMLCGALLAIAGSAYAQNYGNGQSNHPQKRGETTHQQHKPAPQHHEANYHSRPPAPQKHYHGMYEQGHAEGWYRKGGRLPTAYRGNTYVVNNWQTYGLRRPPRGYHWVRSDNNQFLLVAVTTGIISSIVTSMLTH